MKFVLLFGLVVGSLWSEDSAVILNDQVIAERNDNKNKDFFEQEQNSAVSIPSGLSKPSMNLPDSRNYTISFIPYGQIYFVFPGYGAMLRLNNQRFGFQVDGNMTYMNLGYFGSSQYLQVSTSAVYYPFYFRGENSKISRWNITCGMGFLHKFRFDTEFMLGPLSIGYQGKRFFFDFGISISRWIDFSDVIVSGPGLSQYPRFFGPSTKFGICF